MSASTALRSTGSLLAATVTVLALAAAATAVAAPSTSSTIGMSPVGTSAGYFTITMHPGTHRQLTVQFFDHGPRSAQASTYAADVYTSVNGGFAARLDGQATSDPTDWLTYPPASIRLDANKTQTRTFTVTVPNDATPGTHITTLIIQARQPAATHGPVTLSQVSRQALPIIIDIPGRSKPRLASQATAIGRTDLSVAVSNPGNIRIHPAGRLVVRNSHHIIVATVKVKMGTVFPSDTTTVRALLPTLLPAGNYIVTAALADKTVGVATTVHRPLDIGSSPQAAGPKLSSGHGATTISPTTNSSHTSLALIAGLIVAALIVGAGTAYSLTALRRRKTSTSIP
jgi:hypothetical protein